MCTGDLATSNKIHVGGWSCTSIPLMACARAPNSTFAIHIPNFVSPCLCCHSNRRHQEYWMGFFFLMMQNNLWHLMFSLPPGYFFLSFPKSLKKKIKYLMESTMLTFSKLNSKHKHTQANTICAKEPELNVMIQNLLQVLFVFISSSRKSPAGCNGSLDTCIQHKQLSVPQPEPHIWFLGSYFEVELSKYSTPT